MPGFWGCQPINSDDAKIKVDGQTHTENTTRNIMCPNSKRIVDALIMSKSNFSYSATGQSFFL